MPAQNQEQGAVTTTPYIVAEANYTLRLKEDGTISAVGGDAFGKTDVSKWGKPAEN